MRVYRGTTRSPKEIQSASGFQPKKELSLDKVREMILNYCGYNGSKLKPLDLSRLIISSPQPETVSTATDEDCGGYSNSGFVFLIEVDDLEEKEWSDEVLGQPLNVKSSGLNPILMLNADKLEDATVIALKHGGTSTTEITFFTAIDLQNVKKWRTKDGDTFIDFQ